MVLFESQRVLITFLLLCGYFAFTFKSKRFHTSIFIRFYSFFISILILKYFFYVGTLEFKGLASHFDSGSVVTPMIHEFENFFMQIGYVFASVNVLLNHKKQVQFFNKILELEEKVYSLKYQFKNKNTFQIFEFTSIFCMIFIILYYFLCLTVIGVFIYPSPVFISTEVFALSVDMLLTIISCLMILFLLFLVEFLNLLLKTNNLNLNNQIHHFCKNQSTSNLNGLTEILALNNKLTSTFKSFSDCFGIACAGIFLSNVGTLFCEFYIAYITLRNSKNHEDMRVWIFNVDIYLWSVLPMVFFGIFGFKCEKLVNEAQKAGKLLENVHLNRSTTYLVAKIV